VEYLLEKHDRIIFWYAGSGDDTMMKKLMVKYPDRLFLTPERKDLFQVLQNCYFYLSTYPICGGLMYQYAACAEKVPLTLISDDENSGYLINQEQLGIDFESIEELKQEIDRLMGDEKYTLQKSATMKDCVISEMHFQEELSMIMEHGFSSYPVTYKSIDVESFQKIYLDRITPKQLHMNFAQKDSIGTMLRYFPVRFMLGAWDRLSRKIRNKLGLFTKN